MRFPAASVSIALLAALGLVAGGDTLLHAAAPPANGAGQLFLQDLAGIPGKEMLLTEVRLAPGAAGAPHRHDANVLVYVLEGEVLMQVAGQPLARLGPGQTFYEGPDDVHVQSANASASKPARFLAFLVKDKGKPSYRAVESR